MSISSVKQITLPFFGLDSRMYRVSSAYVCVQVRNLTYMVSRRERIKRTLCRVQEQIFHHHIRLLEQGRVAGEILSLM